MDEVGVEPTLFLMSRIYSPLPSPTGHTHPYNMTEEYENGLCFCTVQEMRDLNPHTLASKILLVFHVCHFHQFSEVTVSCCFGHIICFGPD